MTEERGQDGLTLGERLRRLRRLRDMSQTELASKAGMSPSYLSDLERGVRGAPTAPVLEALADGLDVTVDELLGRAQRSGEVKSLMARAKLPPEAQAELEAVERWIFEKYGVEVEPDD